MLIVDHRILAEHLRPGKLDLAILESWLLEKIRKCIHINELRIFRIDVADSD